jgi:hypothetical protein
MSLLFSSAHRSDTFGHAIVYRPNAKWREVSQRTGVLCGRLQMSLTDSEPHSAAQPSAKQGTGHREADTAANAALFIDKDRRKESSGA